MLKSYLNPEWKEYEDLVCEAMQRENSELLIERNLYVVGNLTNQKRQIDIAARGEIAGHEIFVVIDCKKYTRKLDVNDIGSFMTFLDDVGADIGILVTQKGFSEGARILAKKSRIKLDIVTLEELRKFKIRFDFCEECDPGEDHFPGFIQWQGYEGLTGETEKIAVAGYCNWCNTLHIRCQKCEAVTGIPDVLYEESVECLGGCGTFFTIKQKHIGHGMLDFNSKSRKRTNRMIFSGELVTEPKYTNRLEDMLGLRR